MADSDITVTIQGDKELVAKLRGFIGSDGVNLKRGLGASGLYLTKFFSGEVFASRGGVIGKPWPRLNDSYAAWKARRWPGRPPLIQSGEMLRSFQFKDSARKLELWNSSDHFEFHQDGTRHIPQRMMMRIDQQRAARVVKYMIGDITEQMDKADLL
ncbi:hypothetical protein E3T26_08650 [Cryobacterium sp. TMT1-21]|uniref:hypothetical protein n=1 Tax=Cryobacterium sp. TMT1-21 TaxID=1259234 RepID=UPI00106BF456|nr:hypothetical protein [Cryobacterium sp. TMT1-21]TFD14183.1 hypothetical protein E3T26_08650 [Cryobacterium sp. TMT1-21]